MILEPAFHFSALRLLDMDGIDRLFSSLHGRYIHASSHLPPTELQNRQVLELLIAYLSADATERELAGDHLDRFRELDNLIGY